MTPLPPAANARLAPPVDRAIDDWIPLLGAARERLCRLAAAAAAVAPEQAELQLCVGDCLLALDQMHAELQHACAHRRQLELDVFEARIALARVAWPRLQALNFDRCR